MSTKDVIASAKALLAKPQKAFSFGAENVSEALEVLSAHLPSQPKVPAFWITLADAQMMQGKLTASKDSIAKALSLLYPKGYTTAAQGFVPKARSGAPDPFSILPAQYGRITFEKVLSCYKKVALLGMSDRRVRFYIFNMLKAYDDLASAYEWLNCEDLDDAYLAHYVREYHRFDYFDYRICAWFQKRFFSRVAQANPLETRFEFLCFTCLLHDAAENEKEAEAMEASEEMSKKEEEDMLFEINKETQMWRVCRASLLRMQGKLGAAEHEFEMAVESGHSLMVSLAAKVGLAHAKLEQFKSQEALDLYGGIRASTKVAKEGLIISQSEPIIFRPEVVESDACAGAAQCLFLQGKVTEAQALLGDALQADPSCGDALIRNIIHDCQRNALSLVARTLELILDALASAPDLKNLLPNSQPRMRINEMVLDVLHPTDAWKARSTLVKSTDWTSKEAMQGLLATGDIEQLWFLLFACIAENHFDGAAATLKLLMALEQQPPALPQSLDLAAFMKQEKIPQESDAPEHRVLLAGFHVARGNWFDKKLAMSVESFAAYTLAHGLLDEKHGAHRQVLMKLLWKMHKIFLRRETTDEAIFCLKEIVRIAKIDFDPFPRSDDKDQLHHNQKYAKYHFFLGSLYFRLKQLQESVPFWIEAKKSEKYYAAALGYQGICLAQLDSSQLAKARNMLQECLTHGKDTLVDTRMIRMTLAALMAIEGPTRDLPGAIEQYSQVLEIMADNSEVLLLRGGVYLVSEQLETAIADFSTCIALMLSNHSSDHSSNLERALYSRARAFQRLGKYREAIQDYEAIKAPGMQTLELLSNAASAYEVVGSVDKAIFAYEKLINMVDKSDAENYASILHRRAALCSTCNRQDQALKDLDTLITLDDKDIKARHQRGSTLCAKYSNVNLTKGHEENKEAFAFLRKALDDFQVVLQLKPDHVQARIRRKEVCNILNVTLPDDDTFDEDIKCIEKESLDAINADLIIDYALRMAADVQADLKSPGARQFPLLLLHGGKKNAQFESSWEAQSLKIHLDGRCEVNREMFYLKSSTCVRESFDNGLFAFRMCFSANARCGVFTFAFRKSQERDELFRYWHRYKDPYHDPTEVYATPIRLLENVYRKNSNRMDSILHVAKLREEQKQFGPARTMYLAVIKGLAPTYSHDDNKGAMVGKMVPPASRHVSGITEAMCRPVPGNALKNQLMSEAFYRMAVIIMEDPNVLDSERAKLEVAVWYLRVSVKIDGNQKDSQFKLGLLLMKTGEFEDAVMCFRVVTRLEQSCAEGWNNLGVSLDKIGQQDEAVSSFREAMRCRAKFQPAVCNLCIIKLRDLLMDKVLDKTQVTKLIDDLTSASDVNDLSQPSQSLVYSLRGLAYQIRDGSKMGVRDIDLAFEDYFNAIEIDDKNFQSRVGVVCICLDRQDLGAAYPYLEWLVKFHAGSEIVGDLLSWARKIRLVFEMPISNFLECMRMNPSFRALSFSCANANSEPLKNTKELLDVLRFETTERRGLLRNHASPAHKDGQIMSAHHFVCMASLCLEAGDVQRSIPLVTRAIALLPPKGDAIIRAHVWRSLAFEKQGQTELAAIDAAAALHHLGYTQVLDELEKSRSRRPKLEEQILLELDSIIAALQREQTTVHKGSKSHVATGQNLLSSGEPLAEENLKSNTVGDHDDTASHHSPASSPPRSPLRSPLRVPVDSAPHMPEGEDKTELPQISVEFKYSLLCYGGALLQHADVQREEQACLLYVLAQKLLPQRLEAHINLGNLRLQRMQYLGCLEAYVSAAKAMLEEEQHAVGSVYVEPQRRLVDFLQRYHRELGALLQRDSHSEGGGMVHLEGEMLGIGEDFLQATRAAQPHSAFDVARRSLMQEADSFRQLLQDSQRDDPQKAYQLYKPYASALENVFLSLAPEFPEEAEQAAQELEEGIKKIELENADVESKDNRMSQKMLKKM